MAWRCSTEAKAISHDHKYANYLSAQPSSLSAFITSKMHIVAQRPRRRQLNAKVCGCIRTVDVDRYIVRPKSP